MCVTSQPLTPLRRSLSITLDCHAVQTSELEAFVGDTVTSLSSGGGTPGAVPPVNELDKLTRGPLTIDVTGVPINDANIATVVAARQKAAQAWLSWQLDLEAHAHRPGAQVNGQYVYDTPLKQVPGPAQLTVSLSYSLCRAPEHVRSTS